MANYPQELGQDAVCQSHTGHMTGLWFLPTRPLRLNTNECMSKCCCYGDGAGSVVFITIRRGHLHGTWKAQVAFVRST